MQMGMQIGDRRKEEVELTSNVVFISCFPASISISLSQKSCLFDELIGITRIYMSK